MMFSAIETDLQPRSMSATRANPQAPIDRDHLARYTMNDKDLEREILDLFSQTLAQSVETLTEAENQKDWAMASHTLKGSARAVGAWQLAALMEEAEDLNNRPVKDKARRELLIDIKAKAAKTKTFIMKLSEHAG